MTVAPKAQSRGESARRPGIISFLLLCACVGAAALLCMAWFRHLDGLAAATTGASCGCLWLVGSLLPGRLAPSPSVCGFFASFVPAWFMPDYYFLGLGLLFIVACPLAATLFSGARWWIAQRSAK